MRALPSVATRVSSNPDAYVYLAESIRAWPDQAELAGVIQRAGWTQVAWRDLTGGIVALHRREAGRRLPLIMELLPYSIKEVPQQVDNAIGPVLGAPQTHRRMDPVRESVHKVRHRSLTGPFTRLGKQRDQLRTGRRRRHRRRCRPGRCDDRLPPRRVRARRAAAREDRLPAREGVRRRPDPPRGQGARLDGHRHSPDAGWIRNQGPAHHRRRHRLEIPWPDLADYPSFGLVRKRMDFDETLARPPRRSAPGCTNAPRSPARWSTSARAGSSASPRGRWT